MAAQQLCVVDPEYVIFLYITCLYQSRQAKQLVNEAAGSRVSATASVTFFCHVCILLHNQ